MKFITLDEAISYFDEQVPNQYEREEKIFWLNEIDERIYEEIIKPRLPHCYITKTIITEDVGNAVNVFLTLADYNALLGSIGTEFTKEQIETEVSFTVLAGDVGKTFGRLNFINYDNDADGETILLVPDLFKDIYRYWLEAKVDYNNKEIGAYNNASALYSTYFDDFFAWYNRDHRVTKKSRIRL